jgi:diguanylate cyclase (GGDEF)-like protein/PAS domain S-box-containing protein
MAEGLPRFDAVQAQQHLQRRMERATWMAVMLFVVVGVLFDFGLQLGPADDRWQFLARWTAVGSAVAVIALGLSRRLYSTAAADAHKQAATEEALRISNERFRRLADATLEGIVIHDGGRIVEANAAAARMFGVTAQDLIGRSIEDLVAPESLALARYRATAVDGCRVEAVGRRADGSTFSFEVLSQPFPWTGRTVRVAALQDITQHKLAAAALHESEQRYRLMVEASPLPIGVHREGLYVFMNAAALRLTGARDVDEIVGRAVLSLIHPDERAVVAERVRRVVEHGTGGPMAECRFVRLDGEVLNVEVGSLPVTFDEQPAVQIVIHDITERKRAEEQLRRQALHDPLTDLPNRALLDERLEALLRQGPTTRTGALLIADLDHFKEVNDSWGHRFGDLVLREVTARWKGVLSDTALLARVGGDEFAVLLPESTLQHAEQVGRNLQCALQRPFVTDGHRFEIGASIGIAVLDAGTGTAEQLLRRADSAMYAAKQAGSGCVVYRPEYDRHTSDRLALASELREAINRNELILYYQPQINVATEGVDGVEALVRWRHPQRGLVPPDEFISLAEQTGLIGPLTWWVFEAALWQTRAWSEAGLKLPVSVNVSMRNLQDPFLPDVVANLLSRYQVSAACLKVEVTESTLMADPDRARDVLVRLRAMGVQVAMDDFGTGYSSLAYLKDLPLDELKIDRSFVRDLASSNADRAIVRSAIALAHDLGLVVVAEGIEDPASLGVLASIGCDRAQGYLFSRPLPAAELTTWLTQRVGATIASAA